MILSEAVISGFRNFKSTHFRFSNKTLLIGANEAGKTNLLRALQLLLSRDIPESALEPDHTDFHAHTDEKHISILLKFTDAVEECVAAKLGPYISDDGDLFLRYTADWDVDSGKTSYALSAGDTQGSTRPVDARFWLRVLNLRYIAGRRDLGAYIRRERRRLLHEARERRTEESAEADQAVLADIEVRLQQITEKVGELSYISDATAEVNDELKELSFRHEGREVRFDAAARPVESFVESLELTSSTGGTRVAMGGDGRNQQVHLALWAAANNTEVEPEIPDEVVLYAIEEPEAHLHPHQQSRLAGYLADRIKGQVFITTHSPRIVGSFPPKSVSRLHVDQQGGAQVSGGPDDDLYEEAVLQFGYRHKLIDFSSFFADGVVLVEGPSEEILYRACASAIGVDLDRMNLSVVSVNGVGFAEYASLLTRLGISVAVRTDNDIMKVPKHDKYRLAGWQRLLDVAKAVSPDATPPNDVSRENLTGFTSREQAAEAKDALDALKEWLSQRRLFVAELDLEHDLQQALPAQMEACFGDTPVERMQKKKAINMYKFVNEHVDSLGELGTTDIALPLTTLRDHLLPPAAAVDVPADGATDDAADS